MFALTLTLVVVISSAILLYQWWTSALAPSEQEDAQPQRRDETITRPRHRPLDRAA